MGRVCRVAVRGVWSPMSCVLATLGIGSNAKSTLESRPPPGEIGGCWRRWAVAVALGGVGQRPSGLESPPGAPAQLFGAFGFTLTSQWENRVQKQTGRLLGG